MAVLAALAAPATTSGSRTWTTASSAWGISKTWAWPLGNWPKAGALTGTTQPARRGRLVQTLHGQPGPTTACIPTAVETRGGGDATATPRASSASADDGTTNVDPQTPWTVRRRAADGHGLENRYTLEGRATRIRTRCTTARTTTPGAGLRPGNSGIYVTRPRTLPIRRQRPFHRGKAIRGPSPARRRRWMRLQATESGRPTNRGRPSASGCACPASPYRKRLPVRRPGVAEDDAPHPLLRLLRQFQITPHLVRTDNRYLVQERWRHPRLAAENAGRRPPSR